MPSPRFPFRSLTCTLAAAAGLGFASHALAVPFISEIHYDNNSSDINEAIEISGELSTSLDGWEIVLYNGSNGTSYGSTSLSGNFTQADGCGANGGTMLINYPSNGIQNGAPDGVALVNNGIVVEFISYEGTLVAANGPAAGLRSTDIGVNETGTTPASDSLQLVDGSWEGPLENTFGTCTTLVDDSDPEPTPTPTPGEPGELSISELHYDNDGADVGEGIELVGPSGTSLEGWSLVLYNGSNGTMYSTRTLAGLIPTPEGCETGVIVEAIAGIQNGSPDGIALVDNNGTVVEFISYEGTLTATNGPAQGRTSDDINVAESSSTPIEFSLQKIDGIWNSPAANTFGQCAGNTQPPEPVFAKIHEIQGDGENVAIEGDVTIEAIVIGDYQTDAQLRGFFVQEEDSDADNNPSTSEGLFVFCSSCETDVSIGDKVKVSGFANDFFGMTQVNATTEGSIEIISSNESLPSPAVLALPVPITATDNNEANAQINAYYEAVEGMLITIPQTMSVSEYFALARFGQLTLSANGRPRQFTDKDFPSEAGYTAHQISLAARTLILDDDGNGQNSALFNNTPVFFPEPGFSVDNVLRGGDSIDNLSGVMHWSWAGSSGTEAWRIRPVSDVFSYQFDAKNARTIAPDTLEGSLKVASFNVLNYFTTIDDGNPACGVDGSADCRGANSPEELLRQTEKIVTATCAIDADIVGLMEIQNPSVDDEQTPIDTLVEAINERCGPYQAISTGPIGTDAITVGVIFKPGTVNAIGDTAILDSAAFVDPRASGRGKNRPVIAQSFEEIASGGVLTVAVNHLKSKGSRCGEGDDDVTSGQASCNLTRTLAAQVEAQWLATKPTGVDTDNILIIGDLNAYRNEDPIVAFEAAGFIDTVDLLSGPEAYGYVFDGQLGYLDHALSSEALLPFITGVTDWHINADEVNLLDYNDTVRDAGEASFEPKPSALPLYSGNTYRSSDHDPLVVGIQFTQPAPQCEGQSATIYVKDGVIVGGPMNGQRYFGKLLGTAEDDVIVGTDRRDRIRARGGNDLVCSLSGNDAVNGGHGDDRLFGGPGLDVLFGKRGNDFLDGGEGFNILNGSRGVDTCQYGFAWRCEQ